MRHLGTTLAESVFQSLFDEIEGAMDFQFEADISEIKDLDEGFEIHTNKGIVLSNRVGIGTGISEWLEGQAASLGIDAGETRLDLGLRVEMKGDQLRNLLQDTFETKLTYYGEGYSATTYCMNPKGRIIRKHQHGLVMPYGQNARERERPGANLNFTLFIPRYYEDHDSAMEDAKKVIGGINQDRGRIVIQRLEDLKANRQTNSLETNLIVPSLDAVPGNVKEEVPSLYWRGLLEMFDSLEGLIGEELHPDTLLYGIDAKFYEAKLHTNIYFGTDVRGLYLVGDCSGETHSLSQAAASGIYLGRMLNSDQY